MNSPKRLLIPLHGSLDLLLQQRQECTFFHGAENGSNLTSSPIVIEIPGFTTASSGTLTGTTRVLNAAEISQLLSGKWYVNIHSSDFTSGEIRGNIVLVAASTGNGGNNGGGGGY